MSKPGYAGWLMIDRYVREQLKRLWSEEYKYGTWLKVEILASEAWADLGVIPKEAVADIKARARILPERIAEIEKQVGHDVIAFVSAVAETVGDNGRFLHYGMTSYDVVDTALAYRMKEAADIILDDLDRLAKVLKRRAREHKWSVMIGRTHGVHAEPMTFGLKLALWYMETLRNAERMRRAKDVISYGKISGAVGTYAHVDPFVESYVCQRMGLKPAPISTQILQRDRHAEYLCTIAIIGSSLDKFATEIRSLQRTEIREVEEPFKPGQKGSSAMPHKRNPVGCEQISGLSRILRGNCISALENMNLWNERDISNSSVERIIIPDSTSLLDYMLNRFINILEGLNVYPDRMIANLHETGGLIFSQELLLALVSKGMSRDTAYGLVQDLAMKAWNEGAKFTDLVYNNEEITQILSREELDQCFDYRKQIENVNEIFGRLGL